MSKEEQTNIVRAEKAFEFRHAVTYPWNPGTIIAGANLDKMVGLKNTRIRVVRLAAGNVASLYHSHTCEEEWIYILQGQAVLEIEETEHLLGPGDFAGFPAPTSPHQLRNPFQKSVICLMGGSRTTVDMADFPRDGKRMFRQGDALEIYDSADAEEVVPADMDQELIKNMRRSLHRE
jgi:uncharacterized cupin superfamily protein